MVVCLNMRVASATSRRLGEVRRIEFNIDHLHDPAIIPQWEKYFGDQTADVLNSLPNGHVAVLPVHRPSIRRGSSRMERCRAS